MGVKTYLPVNSGTSHRSALLLRAKQRYLDRHRRPQSATSAATVCFESETSEGIDGLCAARLFANGEGCWGWTLFTKRERRHLSFLSNSKRRKSHSGRGGSGLTFFAERLRSRTFFSKSQRGPTTLLADHERCWTRTFFSKRQGCGDSCFFFTSGHGCWTRTFFACRHRGRRSAFFTCGHRGRTGSLFTGCHSGGLFNRARSSTSHYIATDPRAALRGFGHFQLFHFNFVSTISVVNGDGLYWFT